VASRIQLAREEVVDELTVLLTGRRKSYVEALLAFSDPMSVVPTAAFARRRHLLRRIALISREDLMSSRRIVASCAVMALVVFLGGWGAVSAFPLRSTGVAGSQLSTGPGPVERRAHSVTPENPVPRRVYYQEPALPAVAETVSGKVVVRVTLDETGAVVEARPTGIAAKSNDFEIEMTGDNVGAQLERLASERPNVAAAMRDAVHAFADSAITCVRAWRYDPPAQAPLTFSVSVVYGEPFQPKVGDEKVLKVGGTIKPPTKIVDVRPVYPPDARAAGIEGVVILEVRIARDGSIEEAHVIKSIPELDQAAIDAVKQWRFTPTLMNGVPTAVMMTTTISFRID
jgi:protein TonB